MRVLVSILKPEDEEERVVDISKTKDSVSIRPVVKNVKPIKRKDEDVKPKEGTS